MEIRETGSGYFERAIFFVRAGHAQSAPEYTLTQEASRIVERYCADAHLGRPAVRYRLLGVAKLVGAAAVGAAAAVMALKLGVLF